MERQGSERKAKKKTQSLVTHFDSKIKQKYIPKDIILNNATKITFEMYARDWLKINLRNKGLSRKTIEVYAYSAEKHIFPTMGHLLLTDITPLHISRYKEIALGNLSASTVNKHLSFISSVLGDASSDEKRIIRDNPALLVRRAKSKQGGNQERTALTNCLNSTELNDVLSRLEMLYSLHKLQLSQLRLRIGRTKFKEDPKVIEKLKYVGYTNKEIASPKALYKLKASLYPIVYLGAITGMRLSELLALKWQDIDLENKIILVHSSSHYGVGENAHYINPTKEGKPKSYIDISGQNVEFLKQYRKEQLEFIMWYRKNYTDNGLVFARKDGTHLRNNTISAAFSDFVRSIGYNVTFHALRHTHCTLLLAAGVPVMYVSRRLGHQSPSTTHNMYSHVAKANDLKLGEVFQTVLDGSKAISTKNFENAKRKMLEILAVL